MCESSWPWSRGNACRGNIGETCPPGLTPQAGEQVRGAPRKWSFTRWQVRLWELSEHRAVGMLSAGRPRPSPGTRDYPARPAFLPGCLTWAGLWLWGHCPLGPGRGQAHRGQSWNPVRPLPGCPHRPSDHDPARLPWGMGTPLGLAGPDPHLFSWVISLTAAARGSPLVRLR